MYLLGLFAPIQVDVPEFSEVKNPLTPAVAPPTPSANQPPVTRRKWSLFGGYGRNPNCSNNQGWIGQRLTLSDFTASKLVSFSNWLDTARSTSLTFGSTFFGWFGWLKTLESDKSSRLLVRRMVEWLSGKTRPCNPQNSEPSPILPEMSGNKLPQLQVDYWIYTDLPRMLLSLLLDLGLLQVTCYLPDGEATPWAIVEDECLLMYLLALFAPIQVDVPEFSEVKNPLTPAVAPPTPSANQPPVTRRKWSLFGGYGRNPNCSNNQGWIGQRLTLSDFTASKLVSFSNWLDTARSTSLTFGSTFFGWFGWLKTLESDKSSRLLVRRMVEWLSGKTRPCNPQNSEPSPILPEMSGNKLPQLQVDYWIYYDLPRMLLSLLLDLGLLQVICYFSDAEATTWAIVEDECLLMYLLALFAPIQVDVPEFSEVKNPLTPAVAPPTPFAIIPSAPRRRSRSRQPQDTRTSRVSKAESFINIWLMDGIYGIYMVYIYIYGIYIYIYGIYMVYIYGIYIWYIYGVYIWYIYGIYIYGVYIYMVFIYMVYMVYMVNGWLMAG